MNNDLPEEFDQIFGNLKRPPKKLTKEQETGKALMELAKLFPKTTENEKNK